MPLRRSTRRALRLTLALMASVGAAQAQSARDHFPPADQLRLRWDETTHRGQVELLTRGLPEHTSVGLQLELDGGPIRASWHRRYVGRDGRLRFPLGPFARPLLPGTYRVRLVVQPRMQDVRLDAAFASWQRAVCAVYAWPYRPADEAPRRRAWRDGIGQLCRRYQALAAELRGTGEAWRAGTRFHTAGRFTPAPFLAWAHRAADQLADLHARHQRMTGAVLAPYDPGVVRYQLAQVHQLQRLLAIDLTIVPILVHTRTPVPERFRPQRMRIQPSRAQAAGRLRALLAAIQTQLGRRPRVAFESLWPGPAEWPSGFAPGALTEPQATLVEHNPGRQLAPDRDRLAVLWRQLGVPMARQPASIEELGCLVLQPTTGPPLPRPLVVYLVRFRNPLYAAVLPTLLGRRRRLRTWTGRVLARDDVVIVIDHPDLPTPTDAARALARHFRRRGFEER